MPAERPAALAITWSVPTGSSAPSDRARDMARVLGGEPLLVYPMGGQGAARKLARYAISMPVTFFTVLRRRPRAVVAQNPPMFCAFAAFLGAKVLRVPFVLDSHPGGFGLQGDTLSLRLQPLLRWMVPRAQATLVTEATLHAKVEGWGGAGIVFHEAPPTWSIPPRATKPTGPLTVFYVGTFQRDEPTPIVFEAATQLPDVQFVVTGDTALADPALLRAAPANVTFCGWLHPAEYIAALEAADIVLVLTTEPTSVARSGYDAVWANRPLVISDTEAARDAFPFATFTENDGAALAEALSTTIDDVAGQFASAIPAREAAESGWVKQRAALKRAAGQQP